MAITRLSGGLTPADGSDPRTFPAIWNETADFLDGFSVDDLADVDASAPNDGDVLVYDAVSGDWVTAKPAAGARGGDDTNEVFWENDQAVTVSYTITAGKNALTAGPIEIDAGVTVEIPSGSVWSVV